MLNNTVTGQSSTVYPHHSVYGTNVTVTVNSSQSIDENVRYNYTVWAGNNVGEVHYESGEFCKCSSTLVALVAFTIVWRCVCSWYALTIEGRFNGSFKVGQLTKKLFLHI